MRTSGDFLMRRESINYFLFLLVCFVVPITLVSEASCATDLPDAVGILTLQKTRVEEAGLSLIKCCQNDPAKYYQGKSLYNEARAGFNGWIAAICADLALQETPREVDCRDAMLSSVLEKSNRFIEYVKSVRPQTTVGLVQESWPSQVISIIKKALEGLVGSNNEKQRQEMLRMLNRLRILSFSELEAQSPRLVTDLTKLHDQHEIVKGDVLDLLKELKGTTAEDNGPGLQ